MINKIKRDLEEYVGKNIDFVFNGSRNQKERFSGKIEKLYNYVFTIRVKDSNDIKCFSYVDIIINNLVLKHIM